MGYLEWGGGNHTYLFQGEAEIITKLFTDPKSVLHPFTVFPMISQLLLLITLFQKMPNRKLTYIGIIGLSLLLGFMFIIGAMTLNYKIIFSTVPFIIAAILTLRNLKTGKLNYK